MYRNHWMTTPGNSSHFHGLSNFVPDVFAPRQIESFICPTLAGQCQKLKLLAILNSMVTQANRKGAWNVNTSRRLCARQTRRDPHQQAGHCGWRGRVEGDAPQKICTNMIWMAPRAKWHGDDRLRIALEENLAASL